MKDRVISVTRTKLCDRQLPSYTLGEEILNTASHAVGALLGIAALVVCVVYSATKHNVWAVVSSAIYGASLVALYSMSAVYHGLRPCMAKKVMQVIDHCTIYFLIAGTYTPILLCSVRNISPVTCWVIFGVVWGVSIVATVFTAIDLKKYSKLSMICYIGLGWCIIVASKTAYQAIGKEGFAYLLIGGVLYTVGAILYGKGKKHRYVHTIFHMFVVSGSIFHFLCIFTSVL